MRLALEEGVVPAAPAVGCPIPRYLDTLVSRPPIREAVSGDLMTESREPAQRDGCRAGDGIPRAGHHRGVAGLAADVAGLNAFAAFNFGKIVT